MSSEMPGQTPRGPQDPVAAAAASATDAKEAEQNARDAERAAKDAAAKAEAAAKDTEAPVRVAKVNAAISFATWIAIAIQAIFLWKSVDLTRDSIELTGDNVRITNESLAYAKRQERVAMHQQLRADNQLLQDKIYDPDGMVQVLSDLDPSCAMKDPLTRSDQLVLKSLINQVLAHYERYYLITSALDLKMDWKAICRGAKDLRSTYCHIDQRLESRLEGTVPEFQEAMRTCELPASTKQ